MELKNVNKLKSEAFAGRLLEMLNEAGFGSIDIINFEHHFQNDYYIIKKIKTKVK